MLRPSETKQCKIGQKRKLLTYKQHKLLEKAVSLTANTAKKREKIRLVLNFLVVDVQSRDWLLL